MAHSRVVTLMDSYANKAIELSNPRQFLREFSPMHVWWHRGGRMPGFLVFHWYAIQNLKRSGADSTFRGGITPFSESEWEQMEWAYDLSNDVIENDFDSFSRFSRILENWHNEAHMAVMIATGEDMMNASTNIMLTDFWRLHYFIDIKFQEALDRFNANKVSVEMKIEALEHDFHARIGEI